MWLILVSPEQSIIAAGADFIKSKKDWLGKIILSRNLSKLSVSFYYLCIQAKRKLPASEQFSTSCF
jgi:hypothetical protein